MFVKVYLSLLNGLLKLTDSELKVLEEIVWEFHKAKQLKQEQPYISQHVFSAEMRQEIRTRLSTQKEMSIHSLNNFLKGLRDKGVLVQREGYVDIDPKLYPTKEVLFKWKIDE